MPRMMSPGLIRAVRGSALDRGDHLDPPLFLRNLYTQAPELAGGDHLRFTQLFGVQVSRVRIEDAVIASNPASTTRLAGIVPGAWFLARTPSIAESISRDSGTSST